MPTNGADQHANDGDDDGPNLVFRRLIVEFVFLTEIMTTFLQIVAEKMRRKSLHFSRNKLSRDKFNGMNT